MRQVFVFDLDGTLYPKKSELYLIMSSLIMNWFKRHLSVNENDFVDVYEGIKRSYPNVLEAVQAFGFDIALYHKEVFDEINHKYYLLEDINTKNILSKLFGKKFVVTLSSQIHTKRVLSSLDIEDYFSEVYVYGINWHTYRKVDIYEIIRKKYRLLPEEMYVIGDSYTVDLEMARALGYNCILISESNDVDIITINVIAQLVSAVTNISNQKKGR